MVAPVRTANGVLEMLTSAFANRGWSGANGMPSESAATQNPTLISAAWLLPALPQLDRRSAGRGRSLQLDPDRITARNARKIERL